jgi:DNA-directed RNA polymerase specialized sigma24 family protein
MADLSPITLANFWGRVSVGPAGQCWNWTGRHNDKGYGRFGRTMAHRVAYTLVKGDIGEGLVVRHICDNPACCNPAHLLTGTQADNMADAIERQRLRCRESNPRAKLTEDAAQAIRQNVEGLTFAELAKRFGVSIATISAIRSGKTWR